MNRLDRIAFLLLEALNSDPPPAAPSVAKPKAPAKGAVETEVPANEADKKTA